MNSKSDTIDAELDELKKAIIPPLTNYVALSNLVYVDFHGQEEGEDPEHDELTDRWKKAEGELWQAIQALLLRERLDESKRWSKFCYNTKNQSMGRVINERMTELEAELSRLKGGDDE